VADSLPQTLAANSNAMTIVGGVDEEGIFFDKQVQDPTGLVAVWTPAVNIFLPSLEDKIPVDPTLNSGTSQATAIVVCNDLP
jgi:hypothetical protein